MANSTSSAKLMNDIVINNGTVFVSGTYTNNDGINVLRYLSQMNQFNGTFDGCGYTISGIVKNESSYVFNSLFYFTNSSAVIKNLNIDNSLFNRCAFSYNNLGVIENCVNYASFSIKNISEVAGICSTNTSTGIIRNCKNAGNIVIYNTSTAYVRYAGICAINEGKIYSCINTGKISPATDAQGSRIGGICGYNSGSIYNSYNTGSIDGETYVGAICGNSDDGVITNCYYLTGCAKDGSNKVQFGVGAATSGQTTADVAGKTTKKASSQFSSGEVAYLLNSGATDSTAIFYQNLNNGKTVDSVPTLDSTHGKVYPVYTYNSDGFVSSISSYTNTGSMSVYQPAVKISTSSSPFYGYYEIGNAGQLYWFCEEENSNATIKGVLKNNIYLNSGYTFNFEASSGLVKVTKNSTVVGYIGTGMKGTVKNTATALTSGKWFSNNTGTAMTAPTDLRMWTPIGKANAFTGTFDGNGYAVSGMYFSGNNYTNTSSYAGLFGKCKSGAKISDISVENSYIFGYQYLAGVCGELTGGTIERCTSSVIICSPSGTGADNYAGGICGCSTKSNIDNCSNSGLISVKKTIGGVCGYGLNSTYTNCNNTGTVNGGNCVGGVCGDISSCTLSSCYNTGTVNGVNYVGGVCGNFDGDSISYCYNAGTVNGVDNVGGVCGCFFDGTISSCYNTGTVNGGNNVGGVCGYLNYGTVSYCYSTGIITERDKTNSAAIVGYKYVGSISSCYYLETSATCGINANVDGDFGNIYPVGEAERKTAAQFASGEVAYLLNGSKTDGTQIFYQNINNGMTKDAYPKFTGGTVYELTDGYSNSPDIGGKNNASIDFDFTNHYIITENLGVTSLDILLINGADVTFSGTKSNGTVFGTGSTVTQSKNGVDTDYTLIVKGDLDGDGACDVLDCFAVEKAQSGHLSPNNNQTLAADSNNNKYVDLYDYQQIVNKALS